MSTRENVLVFEGKKKKRKKKNRVIMIFYIAFLQGKKGKGYLDDEGLEDKLI